MCSIIPMRAAKIGYIILSAALCVLGAALILFPNFSVTAIGMIFGSLALIFGVIKVLGYFSKDLYRLAFQHDLAGGPLLVIIGIVILTHPDSLMTFVCVTLGLYTLLDGLMRLQTALDSRRFGIDHWWMIGLSAVAAGLLGALLLFCTAESSIYLTAFLGVAILAEGVLNLITVLLAVKIIRNQRPDRGGDYYETGGIKL